MSMLVGNMLQPEHKRFYSTSFFAILSTEIELKFVLHALDHGCIC